MGIWNWPDTFAWSGHSMIYTKQPQRPSLSGFVVWRQAFLTGLEGLIPELIQGPLCDESVLISFVCKKAAYLAIG